MQVTLGAVHCIEIVAELSNCEIRLIAEATGAHQFDTFVLRDIQRRRCQLSLCPSLRHILVILLFFEEGGVDVETHLVIASEYQDFIGSWDEGTSTRLSDNEFLALNRNTSPFSKFERIGVKVSEIDVLNSVVLRWVCGLSETMEDEYVSIVVGTHRSARSCKLHGCDLKPLILFYIQNLTCSR